MKRYLFIVIIAAIGIMILAVTSLPQEKQRTMNVNPNQMQIMEIMRDSSSVNNIMDRMASDSGMRTKLMNKMISRVHGDSSGMMQICKMIMDNKEMHSIMMKMINRK
jgi:predicted hydrolase (HD superfamily)